MILSIKQFALTLKLGIFLDIALFNKIREREKKITMN